jgi:hypothetical protein
MMPKLWRISKQWRELKLGAIMRQEPTMSAIPIHLQRRFEQKWSSRFVPPVASSAPKAVGTKAAPLTGRHASRRKPKKNPPG